LPDALQGQAVGSLPSVAVTAIWRFMPVAPRPGRPFFPSVRECAHHWPCPQSAVRFSNRCLSGRCSTAPEDAKGPPECPKNPSKTRISRRNAGSGLFGATVSGARRRATAPRRREPPRRVPGESRRSTGPHHRLGHHPCPGALHLTLRRRPTQPDGRLVGSPTRPSKNPRVVYGTLSGGFGSTAHATTKTYVDGASGRTVWVHHALISKLKADTDYLYAAQHDGRQPRRRHLPHGAVPAELRFTFTSFGDQGAPECDVEDWRRIRPTPRGRDFEPNATPRRCRQSSTGVREKVGPLFHLLNGGPSATPTPGPDRIRVWHDFPRQQQPLSAIPSVDAVRGATMRSSWATASSVSTRTRLTSSCPSTRDPAPSSTTSGTPSRSDSVKVISLQNDGHRPWQEGGDIYINGYSGGSAGSPGWRRSLKSARGFEGHRLDRDLHAPGDDSARRPPRTAPMSRWRAAYGPAVRQVRASNLVVCGPRARLRALVGGAWASSPGRRHPHTPTRVRPHSTVIGQRVRHDAHGPRRGGGRVRQLPNNSFTTDDADGPRASLGIRPRWEHRRQVQLGQGAGDGDLDRRPRRGASVRLRRVHRRPGPSPR